MSGGDRYCRTDECEKRHKDVDLKIQQLFSLLDLSDTKYGNLLAWMRNIDRKQNWILGVLITLLLAIISGLVVILAAYLGAV